MLANPFVHNRSWPRTSHSEVASKYGSCRVLVATTSLFVGTTSLFVARRARVPTLIFWFARRDDVPTGGGNITRNARIHAGPRLPAKLGMRRLEVTWSNELDKVHGEPMVLQSEWALSCPAPSTQPFGHFPLPGAEQSFTVHCD